MSFDLRIRYLVVLVLLAGISVGFSVAQESGKSNGKRSPAAKTVAERLGYKADARLLVLHADDVGMMHSVNRATIEALNNKWISSASILVPCPWFPELARYAREHPEWDLGIHLALTSEWTPIRWRPMAFGASGSSLTDRDGYLPGTPDTVLPQASHAEIERELRVQIDAARTAGIQITHLDTHMWAAGRIAPEVYLKLGREYGVPVLMDHDVLQPPGVEPGSVLIDRVLGLAPGTPAEQWVAAYENLLRPLPAGVYQLIVHLAYADEEIKAATYDHPDWGAQWRQNDFDLVRSPEFQKFLKDQGFVLISWRDLAKALPSDWKQPK